MPYDLYGTYYASARDAENAEMAQCAAIDADIAMREVNKVRQQIEYSQQNDIWQYVQHLEERIAALELKNKHL